MIISFTGHRPNKLGSYKIPNSIYNYVVEETKNILLELKPEKCISGYALGYDQYAAQVCIDLQIPLIAAIPFSGQERMWPKKSQDHYLHLLTQATETIVVCEGGYAGWKMQRRNEFMVDKCNVLIACFDGTTGGTYNCVRYAESLKKQIIRIDPRLAE